MPLALLRFSSTLWPVTFSRIHSMVTHGNMSRRFIIFWKCVLSLSSSCVSDSSSSCSSSLSSSSSSCQIDGVEFRWFGIARTPTPPSPARIPHHLCMRQHHFQITRSQITIDKAIQNNGDNGELLYYLYTSPLVRWISPISIYLLTFSTNELSCQIQISHQPFLFVSG